MGTTRVLISTDGPQFELPLGIHLIDGAKHCLLAAPKLTSAGFRLWLTDDDRSLLLLPEPSNLAIVLRRQLPSPTNPTIGRGLWHIDFTIGPGTLTTQNTVITLPFLPLRTPAFRHPIAGCTTTTKTAALAAVHTPTAPTAVTTNLPVLHEHIWHGRDYGHGYVDAPTYRRFLGLTTTTTTTTETTAAASSSTDTTQLSRRGRRPPFRSLNGLALHAALGHPPNKKVSLWK